METIEITRVKEIVREGFPLWNLSWYREQRKSKNLKNSTDIHKWKTYVEKLGVSVLAINDIAAITTFWFIKIKKGFTWMSFVALFQKYLALFVDLIALQKYATRMLKLDHRGKMGAD